MTENRRETGPGKDAGPAREQVIIKDKRKIDSSGRPKVSEAADTSKATSPEQSEAAKPAGKPEATMGQPGRGDGASVADDAAEAVTSDETVAPEEIVAGEIVIETNDSNGASGGGGGRHQQVEPDTDVEALRSELDERVRDLQRVSAEYANYRKRVDRDRAVVVEQAMGQVINSLLPILDDLDRARDHDDLVGPFAAMAEQLTAALSKFGLTGFGEPGDAFDPTRHEAVAHQTSAEVTEPSCVAVMRRGYLLGDRLLRPALVAVADPE